MKFTMSTNKTALTGQTLRFPGSCAQSVQRLLTGTGSGAQTNKIIGSRGGGGSATSGATTATTVVTTLYEISVTAEGIAASVSQCCSFALASPLQTIWVIVEGPENLEEFRGAFVNTGTTHDLSEDIALTAWNALNCGDYPKKLRLVG
jgi:hypothetical protein